MVPSAFLLIDALPLTTNGKVDRRACLHSCSTPGTGRNLCSSQHPRRGVVKGISRKSLASSESASTTTSLSWADTLSYSGDFLGKAFQVELPLRRLFEAPTVQPSRTEDGDR